MTSLPLKIEAASSADADAISALILELSEPFYASPSRAGAEVFLASVSPQAERSYLDADNHAYRVARWGAEVVGVVAMRDHAHLFHLFVARRFQGIGLASKLWHVAKTDALQAGNPGAFTVNASLNAVPVYERFGFSRVGETRTVHGICFQPMRARLVQNDG